MSNRIALIGFGELGTQFYRFLVEAGERSFCIFDDKKPKVKYAQSFLFADYMKAEFGDCRFLVALGYKQLNKKSEIIHALHKENRNLISFIHPTSYVSPDAKIGSGTFIYPCCNIDQEVKIGEGVLINNSVCISHNSNISDGAYLSPGVVLSGYVSIGEHSFLGTGTLVSNKIKIGKNVRLGIGSVVTGDLPDFCSAVGNPLRILEKQLDLI